MKTMQEISTFVQQEKDKQRNVSPGHEDAQMLTAIEVAEQALTEPNPIQFKNAMIQGFNKNVMKWSDTPAREQFRIAINYFINYANS